MKLAILCSGQAGQHPRMLDELLTAPDLASLRDTASTVLGQDIADWWHGLSDEQIFLNENAQFAIAFYQLAHWSRLSVCIPKPDVIAGYSLGEVLAWHIAGAMDACSTLRLVQQRAALMDRYSPLSHDNGCLVLWRGRMSPHMRAVRERLLVKHRLTVAIYRPGGDLVLGGQEEGVNDLLEDPETPMANVMRLNVSVPSHTAWLSAAVEPFRESVVAHALINPQMPVLSGIDGRVLRHGEDAAHALSQQLAHPLHWDWCQESLSSMGIQVALELGPGSDLAKLFASSAEQAACRSIEEFSSIAALQEWISKQ